jgi:hypothetical protein
MFNFPFAVVKDDNVLIAGHKTVSLCLGLKYPGFGRSSGMVQKSSPTAAKQSKRRKNA